LGDEGINSYCYTADMIYCVAFRIRINDLKLLIMLSDIHFICSCFSSFLNSCRAVLLKQGLHIMQAPILTFYIYSKKE